MPATAGAHGTARKKRCAQERVNDPTQRLTVGAAEVKGMTCAHGRSIMLAVSRWLDPAKSQLGSASHPTTLGYRCRVTSGGEFAWNVTCRRAQRVVFGFAVE
jgi:hypothetical protein